MDSAIHISYNRPQDLTKIYSTSKGIEISARRFVIQEDYCYCQQVATNLQFHQVETSQLKSRLLITTCYLQT